MTGNALFQPNPKPEADLLWQEVIPGEEIETFPRDRPGIETQSYSMRSETANHYATGRPPCTSYYLIDREKCKQQITDIKSVAK